jgi:general secretion pathway protein G
MLARPTTARRLAPHARGGFTLLEVLVVVAILVILASVATFATVRYLRSARVDQATLQMQKIQQAIKAYHVQTGGVYPSSLEELAVATQAGPPYLEGGASAITDPWGQPYQYEVVDDGTGSERVVVFTVFEGQRIQWPRQ